MADTSMGTEYDCIRNIYRVGPMYFRQWFAYFFDECYDSYKEYCSSGSIKKEKTLKRIELMELSFKEYFELDNPDEAGQENAGADESPLTDDRPAADSPPVESGTDRTDKTREETEAE